MDTSRTRLRVVVADDHAVIRQSLRLDLEAAGVDVCGEAATGAEAVAAARRHRPDLCLLDVQMPEGGGIFAAKEIDRWLPATKVLLLTATPDAAGALAAACVGAAGYLAKDVNRTRLAHVVLAVAAGESSYPRGLLHLVLAAVRDARQCSAI